MKRALMAALVAVAPLFSALPLLAQPLPGFSQTYLCDGGAVIRVAYINPEASAGYAVVDWAGRLIAMRAVPAASGVWYVAFDEQDGFRWRTQGDEAMLGWLAADHTATEQRIVSGCRTVG